MVMGGGMKQGLEKWCKCGWYLEDLDFPIHRGAILTSSQSTAAKSMGKIARKMGKLQNYSAAFHSQNLAQDGSSIQFASNCQKLYHWAWKSLSLLLLLLLSIKNTEQKIIYPNAQALKIRNQNMEALHDKAQSQQLSPSVRLSYSCKYCLICPE